MVQAVVDLLFPPRCAGCRASGAWFCDTCQTAMYAQRQTGPRCGLCDRPAHQTPCPVCLGQPPVLAGLRVLGEYTPPLKPAIWALKFGGKRELGRPLGMLLARLWREQPLASVDSVVTIPMQRDRQRQRGYNPAEELAASCARALGLPLWRQAVVRTRPAPPQRGLDAAARQANVAGLFACPPRLVSEAQGKRVLLIDDVTTTGATLNAVAAAFMAAGATSVWGMALARPSMRELRGEFARPQGRPDAHAE